MTEFSGLKWLIGGVLGSSLAIGALVGAPPETVADPDVVLNVVKVVLGIVLGTIPAAVGIGRWLGVKVSVGSDQMAARIDNIATAHAEIAREVKALAATVNRVEGMFMSRNGKP